MYLYISSVFPNARVLSTTSKLQKRVTHHRHHHYLSPENYGKVTDEQKTSRPLKMRSTSFLETSLIYHPVTRRDILELRRPKDTNLGLCTFYRLC